MNRIILIGNGFDLAHGLKTSYRDFIDSYWKGVAVEICKDIFRPYEDELVKLGPTSLFEARIASLLHLGDKYQDSSGKNGIIPDFHKALMKVDSYNALKHCIINLNNASDLRFELSFKNDFWKLITEKTSLENWVDIEFEFYSLLTRFCTGQPYSTQNISYKTPQALNDDLKVVKGELIDYLYKIQNEKITYGIVNEEIKNKIYDRCHLNIDRLLLLNFNYTHTAALYLANPPNLREIGVINIHGELIKPGNPVIFGYGDEMDEEYKKIVNRNDNAYLQNIKSIRYLETDNYQRLLSFIDSEPYEIYIMGHSCGNSDRTLLNTLFEHKNCGSIRPFYYRKRYGTDDYMNIVQNIYRNFKDAAVMRERVVNKTHCEPLPQNK